jgi:hypothetical protein
MTKKKPERTERLIPIVDEVVELMLARLQDAALEARKEPAQKRAAKPKPNGRAAAADHSDGLAGAVVDLLVARLARTPGPSKRAASRDAASPANATRKRPPTSRAPRSKR